MRVRRPFGMTLRLAIGLCICGAPPLVAQDAASLNPMRAVERSALKGFLERPLFDPSRRRPQAALPMPVAAASAPIEPPPTLHLLGVVHGDRDMAIVQRDGESKTIILRTGDHIGDWILTVLPPVGVRLRSGNRIFEYALFGKAAVGARPVDASPAEVSPAVAVPVAGDPVAIGPVDSIGMPEVMPSSWNISPD